MTAPRDPDDLASALLDGLLTDDEATVAQGDPAVVARLAELTAVREAVRRPPAGPDPVARERGVAAALAAFEAGETPPSNAAPAHPWGARSPPEPRGGLGARRAAAGSRPPPCRGLAVVGLGVLASNWDTGSDNADNAPGGDHRRQRRRWRWVGQRNGRGARGRDRRAGRRPDVAPGGIVDLGEVDSSEALAERARSALASGVPEPLSEASSG